MRQLLSVFLPLLLFTACDQVGDNAEVEQDGIKFYQRHAQDPETGEYLKDSLTYLGNHPVDSITGEIDPQPVSDWTFVDQLGRPVSNADLRGKVHVVEFFFISCPTICPKVKGQMLRLEEEFADEEDFALVSFTVDPKRDTPQAMKEYAEKLGIKDMDRWRFIHGNKFKIYDLDEEYLSIAKENPNAPGGFDHSGYIVLVDREGYVRSYASGLQPEEVDYLMDDIRLLLDKG